MPDYDDGQLVEFRCYNDGLEMEPPDNLALEHQVRPQASPRSKIFGLGLMDATYTLAACAILAYSIYRAWVSHILCAALSERPSTCPSASPATQPSS
jgi:hypothetical protein